jgi:TPP-dependent pyruvate/acetoin dehydrogenase alpha subunit
MVNELVVEALKLMMLSRAFDRKAVALNRQGVFGVYLEVYGQEASVVGSCMALDPNRDWIVPQARELPAYVHHGYPLERLTALFMGKVDAACIPDGVRMLPLQIAIAAQLPHAVGLAWGLHRQGGNETVICYFGEGASSEGDFHEACNLAGVVRAPVVFFLQNNGWAISTPGRLQTAAGTYAQRANGYGFPGIVVDGNDLFAVFAATSKAVRRARAGNGPTLIESRTFRLGAHNTTDNPNLYIDSHAFEAARALDPIERVRTYLVERGAWSPEREAVEEAEIATTVENAVSAALQMPSVRRSNLFDYAYAMLPPRVVDQHAEN